MPDQPHAIVVIGVAGSGKTTVARALAQRCGLDFLDADDLHGADAKAQMAAGVPLTDAQREPWVDALARALRARARLGRSSVLAYSGLRAAHRQRLRDSGVPMRFIFLHAAPAAIAARLALRHDHFLPAELLDSQLQALQPPTAERDVVAVEAGGSRASVLDAVLAAVRAP
jgi:gluconokinase